MRPARTLLLAAALCGAAALTVVATAAPAPPPASAAGAKAQPQWYSVEVLVFRYTGPQAAQGVVWPRRVPAPPLAGAIYPPTAQTAAYAPVAAVSNVMAQAWQRLAATAGYAPVAQIGWKQPGYDTDRAAPVSLEPLPRTATASGAAPAIAAGMATRPVAAPAGMSAPAAGSALAPAVKLSGTATFVVSANKPYVKLDLRLCEPPPPGLELQAPTASTAAATALAAMTAMAPISAPALGTAPPGTTAAGQCFALAQSRQVTPGQLEYFDTAAFGVLALVNPVTTPAGAATALPAAHKHG